MIELLAAYVVGQVQVGPNLIQTDYINEDNALITVTEVLWDKELPEIPQ